MCQFCTEHAEGRKWYLEMKNYSDELLHAELPERQQQATRARTRAEWLKRFMECFEMPAVTGIPKTLPELAAALATAAPAPAMPRSSRTACSRTSARCCPSRTSRR